MNESAHELFDGSGVSMKETQAFITPLNPLVSKLIRIRQPLGASGLGDLPAHRTFSKQTSLDTNNRRGALTFA